MTEFVVSLIGFLLVLLGAALGRITGPQRSTRTLVYYDGLIDGLDQARGSIARTARAMPDMTVSDVTDALDDVVRAARQERDLATRWSA